MKLGQNGKCEWIDVGDWMGEKGEVEGSNLAAQRGQKDDCFEYKKCWCGCSTFF